MIYLASQSPRRRELLEQINIAYRLLAVDTDETPLTNEAPADYVVRMALQKAEASWDEQMTMPVLCADTSVILDNSILGKPKNKADFLNMLHALSGRTHQVMTAVAMTGPGQAANYRLSVSEVDFRKITQHEAETYWQTHEPADKAGGYAVQGLAAIFIREIRGSYSGVMGLPLFETAELLNEFGIKVL